MYEGKYAFEKKRMEHEKIKRKLRKSDGNDVLNNINEHGDLKCNECGRICFGKAGPKNHMKSHISQLHIDYE